MPEETDRSEPHRPTTAASYGIPTARAGLLDWEFVADAMRTDRQFWVGTVRPDGFPHLRPAWGVWLDGTFHCGGGSETRWVRNLDRDPRIVVHRDDAQSVVILEGTAERLDVGSADPDRLARIDAAYEAKYGIEHGTPVFAVHPERVLAWRDFPADATRWTVDPST